MFSIKAMFTPDNERYKGVRPINIYFLRLLFFLVVLFVASDSWPVILKHQGQWKVLWVVVLAYPLWSTNQLAGSPAEEMTHAFVWVILPIMAMPWGYAFRTYVWPAN